MSDFRKQVRDHYEAQSLPAEKLEAILARGREAAAEKEKTVEFPAVKKKSWGRYAMIEFFAHEPKLHEAIQDKTELRTWLVAQGAPADFKIPAKLLPLQSAACQEVDVKGRSAYLSCYVREQGPDGKVELIHLLVAHSKDFYDQPKGAKAEIQEIDGWSFASWTEGDAIYTLATAAPQEKLRPFLSVAGPANERLKHLSALEAGSAEMALLLKAGR
jgi:hypothetical protein